MQRSPQPPLTTVIAEPERGGGRIPPGGPGVTSGGRRFRRVPAMLWERRHRVAVAIGDVVATAGTVTAGTAVLGSSRPGGGLPVVLAVLTLTIMLAFLVPAWDHRVLGQGSEEFHRLGRAALGAGVLLAFLGLATGTLRVRPWVFAVLPIATLLCTGQRYLLRKILHRRRSTGRCLLPVIAAGTPDALAELISRTRRESHLGWQIRAVCTPSHSGGEYGEIDSVSVVGALEDLVDRVREGGYRVVVVGADPYWTRRRLQHLAWELEGTPAELVVAPVLMDMAGPRVRVSEVLGLPLLRLSEPVFTGPRLLVKSLVDRSVALVMLLVLMPLLAVLALAIKLDDGGPVMYRQRRVGKNGRVFTMFKFRTMVRGAEAQRARLVAHDEEAGPLFKSRRDPRLTGLGLLLRGYSLDELPQLLNVLAGRMSLVGPRPPLPEEMSSYTPEVHRKFLVTPGMTGLWQVSGRSDLSWSESVRLDLRYVENWSLALDAMILWKTVRAVLSRRGAY